MSAIFEVAERLQDTQAALLELERTISQNPLEASLLLTRDSLIKRQIALEEEFASITDNEAINVCSTTYE